MSATDYASQLERACGAGFSAESAKMLVSRALPIRIETGDDDLIATEHILADVERAANTVFPVIHSGPLPFAGSGSDRIHKAARFLCLKGRPLARALRFACEHLNDNQLEQLEEILNQ